MKKFVILGLIIGLVIALGGFVFIESRGKKPTFSESEKNQEELLSIEQRTSQDINFINQSIISLSADYKKFSGEDKKEIFSTLREQAELRKKEMLNLAQNDPAKFLSGVMPQKIVDSLPKELRSNFEKEAVVNGRLEEIHEHDFINKTAEFFYSIIDKRNQTINFFPVGEEQGLISGKEVRVRGYQLENNLVAPVSKNTFEILPMNGNLPSSFNIKSPFGVPIAEAQAQETRTIGEQKIAVILLKYGESESVTKDDMKRIINEGSIQSFYREASYGKIWLNADVFGWYKLPSGTPTVSINAMVQLLNIAVNLSDADINFNDYKTIFLIFSLVDNTTEGFGTTWPVRVMTRSQDGDNFASATWLTWNSIPSTIPGLSWSEVALMHEFGHNIGAKHANGLECTDLPTDPFYGATCKYKEFNNEYDIMGYSTYSLHFNAGYKDYFQWFDTDSILEVTQSGRYTLKALESNSGVRAIKIIPPKKIDNTTFYLETRRAIGFDSSLATKRPSATRGIFINQYNPESSLRSHHTLLIGMGTRKSPLSYENLGKGDEPYDFSTYGIKIGPVVSDDAEGTTVDIVLDGAPLPPCERKTPVLTVTGADNLIKTIAGNIRLFPLSFKSADSVSCLGVGFQTSVTAPTGWVVSVLPDQADISLGPDEVGTKNIQVEVPATAVSGIYDVVVIVKNTDGDLVASKTIQYGVIKEFQFNFINYRKIKVISPNREPAPIPKVINDTGVIFETPEGASSGYELGDE